MKKACHLANCADAIVHRGQCAVACVGGSLTVGEGAFTASEMPWRQRFMKYLTEAVAPSHHCAVQEIQAAIGAMKSYGSVFTLRRNVIAHNPSLVFIEFGVNDSTSPDKELTRKSVEGLVRQLLKAPGKPDVALLGAGARPGWGKAEGGLVDHSIHRAIAEHYGVPFLDIQEHLLTTIKARGQTWDAVAADEKDDLHLNDEGNRLWFECMRDWFDAEFAAYDSNAQPAEAPALPPPLFDDEFESPNLLVPTPTMTGLVLEGSWEVMGRDKLELPWHLETVLAGRPGDRLTYRFRGTAFGTVSHVYDNGLKVQAWVDGEEVPGPYTNYREAYCNFDVLKHGLEDGEHEIRMAVGQPSKRRNVLEDPTARLGYFGIAPGRAT